MYVCTYSAEKMLLRCLVSVLTVVVLVNRVVFKIVTMMCHDLLCGPMTVILGSSSPFMSKRHCPVHLTTALMHMGPAPSSTLMRESFNEKNQ